MKILVLCLPAIGDGLMVTPMIKVLKKKFPDATIDVACMMSGVQYIFENNPFVNHVYYLSLYSRKFIRGIFQVLSLRRKKYDVSILSFPSYRREYHWVQAVIGAKKRIAHSFSTGYWLEFNFLNTDLISVDETNHNVINNLNLIHALGINWRKIEQEEKVKYYLKLDQSDDNFGKKYIKKLGWANKKVVAIHPGSTNSPAALLRRWPSEKYALVANFLISKGYKVLIFVGPDEKELGNQLLQLSNNSELHLVNNVKFNQSLGILNQTKLLICNDNGFGHLANAMGIKIVTLWASTNDKWSLPYNKKLVSLVRPPNFDPWYKYVLKRHIPKGVKSGMDMIQASEVIKTVKKSLSSHK